MPPTLYFDTNVFRYFASAFNDAPIEPDLRDHFAISPLSLLELLSQLATPGAGEAFRAAQTLLNVFGPDYTAILPWQDEVLRVLVFGAPAEPGNIAELLNNATQNVLNARSPADVEGEARELRDFLAQAKYEAAENFAQVLASWRQDGPIEEVDHRRIFAVSTAHRAGVPPEGIDPDGVIMKLNAYWIYETRRIENAAGEPDYNPHNHQHENDAFDSEQLVYLAHPDLHFLTTDGGFRKAPSSAQYNRIHRAPPRVFENATLATNLIRSIVQPASMANPA
ncbi:MAG TPA: hypothetical protein VN776_12400 [Terracidiphilus sp.]|nr:hypothetical protein [Terracidiphilus sp.]